jgi:4-carboxymuconolactone decarboxylase
LAPRADRFSADGERAVVQKERTDMARIPYAPTENPGADHALNLFRMLAHSPPVLKGFGKLGGALLSETKLSPKLRETAILRVGLRAGASYEVDKHMQIAKLVGVTEAELAALRPGSDLGVLDEPGRAVVALSDELFLTSRASDAVFERLRRFLDYRELVELVVTIGYYGLVCRVLETFGIDEEA